MSLQLDFKRFHRRARYLATKWKVNYTQTDKKKRRTRSKPQLKYRMMPNCFKTSIVLL
jgi:hypothetical protein